MVLHYILDGGESLFLNICRKGIRVLEILRLQFLAADAAGQILHLGEDLFPRIEEVGDIFVRRRLQIQALPADEVLEFLVELILVVEIVGIAVVVHEHDEFLAAEPGHVRVPLLMGQIPPLENDIIVISRLIAFHASEDVKKAECLALAGSFAGCIDYLEEFTEAGLPEHPQIILHFIFFHGITFPYNNNIRYLTTYAGFAQ